MPTDVHQYVQALEIPELKVHAERFGIAPPMLRAMAAPAPAEVLTEPAPKPSGALIGGQVAAFTAGLTGQDKQDVEYTTLAAQLNSDVVVPNNQSREGMQAWFKNYATVMSNLGWIMSFNWEQYTASTQGLTVDKAFLEVLAAIATQNGVLIAQAALNAVSKLPTTDGHFRLFSNSSAGGKAGKFLLGVATKEKSALSLAYGAFAMDYQTRDTTVLWFNWKSSDVSIYKDQKIATFNQAYYANRGRAALEGKLAGHVETYVSNLDLGF
jgi:hypothetical protein